MKKVFLGAVFALTAVVTLSSFSVEKLNSDDKQSCMAAVWRFDDSYPGGIGWTTFNNLMTICENLDSAIEETD